MEKALEKTRIITFSVVVLLFMAGLATAAETFGFVGVSRNNPDNVAIGEAQFSFDVVDYGNGFVEFVFKNSGPEPSTISNLYFSAGDPAVISLPISFTDVMGTVSFSQYASPPEMQGDPTFVTTAGFTADADNPKTKWGVDPGEQLGVLFLGSYDDVIAGLESGDVRVGIHAISIGLTEDSEWFVNTPGIPVVPTPSSIALGSIGLGLISLLRNRKKA